MIFQTLSYFVLVSLRSSWPPLNMPHSVRACRHVAIRNTGALRTVSQHVCILVQNLQVMPKSIDITKSGRSIIMVVLLQLLTSL